jgi:hypothetical protein
MGETHWALLSDGLHPFLLKPTLTPHSLPARSPDPHLQSIPRFESHEAFLDKRLLYRLLASFGIRDSMITWVSRCIAFAFASASAARP